MNTEKTIFYDMLHESRRLKGRGWRWGERQAYRLGMLCCYTLHRDKLLQAEAVTDWQKCWASGQEPIE